MNIKEIRSAITEFFRKRRMPEPKNMTDEQAQQFHARCVGEGRTRIVRHGTRNAHLRASGASTPAPAPEAPSVSDDDAEREAMHRQALSLRIANLK